MEPPTRVSDNDYQWYNVARDGSSRAVIQKHDEDQRAAVLSWRELGIELGCSPTVTVWKPLRLRCFQGWSEAPTSIKSRHNGNGWVPYANTKEGKAVWARIVKRPHRGDLYTDLMGLERSSSDAPHLLGLRGFQAIFREASVLMCGDDWFVQLPTLNTVPPSDLTPCLESAVVQANKACRGQQSVPRPTGLYG